MENINITIIEVIWLSIQPNRVFITKINTIVKKCARINFRYIIKVCFSKIPMRQCCFCQMQKSRCVAFIRTDLFH